MKLNEVMRYRALHDKSGWGVVGLPDQIGPWKTNMLERWELDGNRTRLEPVRSVALVQLGSLSGASWIGEPVVEAILLPLHSSPNSDFVNMLRLSARAKALKGLCVARPPETE